VPDGDRVTEIRRLGPADWQLWRETPDDPGRIEERMLLALNA